MKRRRKRFKPHLFLITEKESAQSNLVDLFGYERLKTVQLPQKITQLTINEQLLLIQKIILQNQKELDGKTAFFGKIIAYKYCKYAKEPEYEKLYFDVNGHIMFNELNLYSLQELTV